MTRRTTALSASVLLLAAFILLAATRRAAMQPPSTAEPPRPIRVTYSSIDDIERLVGYDLLEVNHLAEQYVVVLGDTAVYKSLQRAGWDVAYDTADTQPNALDGPDALSAFSGGYRTVAELEADLQTIATAHPTLTELFDYGDSHCKTVSGCTAPNGQSLAGHDLWALRITNEAISGASTIDHVTGTVTMGSKPVFFLMANIHAREITTPELAMRFIDQLVDGYGVDPDITWMVDAHEIWVVPTANPDGHWYVELGVNLGGSPYYHRKNANNDTDNDGTPDCTTWPPTSSSQLGVDLNRNHTFAWNMGGSSARACAQTYRGPSAGSEVETAAIETLISSLIPDQRGPLLTEAAPDDTTGLFISLHSYSELVLWPWGHTSTPPPNAAGLAAIGEKFATYNGYTPGQASTQLYVASGMSDEWAYGTLGIPAYTFEVGTWFMPTYSTIDSNQWPKNGPAFLYAARIARTPYQTALGPDITSQTISVAGAQAVTLTAAADDTHNGNQAIGAAEFYIDTPPWDGGTPVAFSAEDGAFDTAVETATHTLAVNSLSAGRHQIFMRAQDADGNWGPISAAFLDLPLSPDASGPTTTDLAVQDLADQMLSVTATIDDTTTGNANIGQAQISIDLAPDSGGTPQAMTAVDGQFNAASEEVTTTVDTRALSTGDHTLFVRGQDALGNWGPVSQMAFTVNPLQVCGVVDGQQIVFATTPAVTVDITTAGTLDCLTLERTNAAHTHASSTIATDGFWHLAGIESDATTPAVGFDLTLTLPHPAPTPANAVCRHVGPEAAWDCGRDSLDVSSETVTRAGVVALGDFAIADGLTGLPTAVVPTATINTTGQIILNWLPDTTANCAQQLFEGTSPFFTPTGTPLVVLNSTADTHPLSNRLDDPTIHHFYLIRTGGCDDPAAVADSQRVGEFEFAIHR